MIIIPSELAVADIVRADYESWIFDNDHFGECSIMLGRDAEEKGWNCVPRSRLESYTMFSHGNKGSWGNWKDTPEEARDAHMAEYPDTTRQLC